jgi:hypothetical protein
MRIRRRKDLRGRARPRALRRGLVLACALLCSLLAATGPAASASGHAKVVAAHDQKGKREPKHEASHDKARGAGAKSGRAAKANGSAAKDNRTTTKAARKTTPTTRTTTTVTTSVRAATTTTTGVRTITTTTSARAATTTTSVRPATTTTTSARAATTTTSVRPTTTTTSGRVSTTSTTIAPAGTSTTTTSPTTPGPAGASGGSEALTAAAVPGLGVLGVSGDYFAQEKANGIKYVTVGVGWANAEPANGSFDVSYASSISQEIVAARAAGLGVILDPGLQYAPAWALTLSGGTQFVDQYGDIFTGSPTSGNDVVNAVTDMAVRSAEGSYLQWLGAQLSGAGLVAIRVGGGPFGELRYPEGSYNGHTAVPRPVLRYQDGCRPPAPWRRPPLFSTPTMPI